MNTKIGAGLILVSFLIATAGLLNLPVVQSVAEEEEGFNKPRHEKMRPRFHEEGEREKTRPRERQRPRKEEDIEDIDIDAVVEFLEEVNPDMLERLEYLEEENPEEFFGIIHRVWREMKKLEMLKKRHPEMYESVLKMKKLGSQARSLAKQYRETEDVEAKEKIKTELKSVLGQIFDAKIQERAKRIKQLEEKLKKQREELEKQKSERGTIVEERLLKLTGEKVEWKW